MLKGKSEESTSESPLISIFVSRIRDFRPKGQNLIRKKKQSAAIFYFVMRNSHYRRKEEKERRQKSGKCGFTELLNANHTFHSPNE